MSKKFVEFYREATNPNGFVFPVAWLIVAIVVIFNI